MDASGAPAKLNVVRPPHHVVLFDLDGTLVLTGGAGRRALDAAFERTLGISGALGERRLDGMTDPVIVREVLGDHRHPVRKGTVQSVLEAYVDCLKDELPRSPGYRVLEEVRETLLRLSTRSDVTLGLATGNIEEGARLKLGRADLNRFLPFGGFASDAEDRSEIVRIAIGRASGHLRGPVDLSRTYVVGDTPRDVLAARASGARPVAVSTGSYRAEDLYRAGAETVLANVGELEEALA